MDASLAFTALSMPQPPLTPTTHTHPPNQPKSHPTLQLVFRNPITTTGAVGSAVGVGGVLLYTLVKQHYDGQQQK